MSAPETTPTTNKLTMICAQDAFAKMADSAVAAAEWENGTKVYARHDEGEAALWYDPESGKLHDHNEAARVATEAEADALALEWMVCRMQDEA